ncbi:hypothetical protein [Furfurilactobacillus cerevisiae]|uniref:hypothetical protein n=1 Tax=Furfurilactobacillus rossiae TaxID=231049 RepID=UPI003B97E30A
MADLRTTDTRQRIVEYAVKFVGENDFHLLSLRTAAKTVGIAPSAVYKVDCKFNPNFWTNWSA